MWIIVNIAIAATLSGLIAIGINRVFPKRGNWLPVMTATFVPPILHVAYSVYRALIELGLAAEPDGAVRTGARELFMTSMSALVFFTVIWLIVAVPASFTALHLFRRK
jgi:hypothetical protein